MRSEIPNVYPLDTQKGKIITMLKAAPEGLTLRAYLPEYRSRCNELRKDGYDIPDPVHEADSKFVRFKLLGYSPLFREAC